MDKEENKKQENIIPVKTAIIIIVSLIMMGTFIFGGIGFFIYKSLNAPEKDDMEALLENTAEGTNEINIGSDEYKEDLGWILSEMKDEVEVMTESCGIISQSWKSAILYNKDINQSVYEGLQIIEEIENKYGPESSRDYWKEKIKDRLQKVTNPPQQYQNVYNLTVEAYGYYLELYDYVGNPSGSYETYVESYNKAISEFNKIIEKISVIDPSINID